jgi:hypothetical protein
VKRNVVVHSYLASDTIRTELNNSGATERASDIVGLCLSGDIDRQEPDDYEGA